jgi:hypothetical protein
MFHFFHFIFTKYFDHKFEMYNNFLNESFHINYRFLLLLL